MATNNTAKKVKDTLKKGVVDVMAGKDKEERVMAPSGVKDKDSARESGVKPSRSLTDSNTTTTPAAVITHDKTDLREAVMKLQSELETEHKLRREQAHQHKLDTELRQAKASVAAKESRARMLADKQRELDLQKETLQRKHDTELAVLNKQRENEVGKLKHDLKKCQDQLRGGATGASPGGAGGGGSGRDSYCKPAVTAGRNAFEAERAKLTAETQVKGYALIIKKEKLEKKDRSGNSKNID